MLVYQAATFLNIAALFCDLRYKFYIYVVKSLSHMLQENFSYISRALSGSESSVSDKSITSFLRKLKKVSDIRSLGEWFAWYYVAFQFSWWYDKAQMSRLNGKFAASWIFGDKAIERWVGRNDSWKYWTDKFISDTELSKPVEFAKAGDRRDIERKMFYNTDLGFLTCQASGLYEEDNPLCIACKNRSLCRSMEKG